MTLFETYLLIHVVSSIVCLGFTLAKADSPFVEADRTFWVSSIFFCIILSPVMLLIILGIRLHDK